MDLDALRVLDSTLSLLPEYQSNDDGCIRIPDFRYVDWDATRRNNPLIPTRVLVQLILDCESYVMHGSASRYFDHIDQYVESVCDKHIRFR